MNTLFFLILGITIFIFVTGVIIFVEAPSFILLVVITLFIVSFVFPFSKVAPPSQQGWVVWYLVIFGTLLFLLYHFFYLRLPSVPSFLTQQTTSLPISPIRTHHITSESIASAKQDIQNVLVNGVATPLQDESVRGFDEEMRVRKLQIQQLKEIL